MDPLFVHPDIAQAKTISKAFYTSPVMWEACKEKIFAKTWQWLAYEPKEKAANHCFPTTLLPGYFDEPLLLTRDKEGNTRCISNVCTHRGAILLHEACTAVNIRCPYHGRMFDLSGHFKSMPGFEGVQDFPTSADNLHALPLKTIAGNCFTQLETGLSFEDFFGAMLARLDWLPMDAFTFRPDLSKDYQVLAHWALYCENYLEGFHIPFVHLALNQALDFGNYRTELFRFSSLQVGIAKENEDCFVLPPSSQDYGQRIAAYYWYIFPNLMFNFYPWGLSLNIVQPLAPNQTRVRFLSFVWQEDKLQQGAGADVDSTELEDEAIVESVQAGIGSRFYGHGRYSVKYETGTHHFHRLVSEFMMNENPVNNLHG